MVTTRSASGSGSKASGLPARKRAKAEQDDQADQNPAPAAKRARTVKVESEPSAEAGPSRRTDTKPGLKKGAKATPKAKAKVPASVLNQPFPYDLPLKSISLRAHPYLYRPGKGEQGIFHVRPYKDELLPLWKFKDEESAAWSCAKLEEKFEEYKTAGDYVGCESRGGLPICGRQHRADLTARMAQGDMARKYIQMGFTRARRYANNKSGRKYTPTSKQKTAADGRVVQDEEKTPDQELKARCAEIFRELLTKVKEDEGYERCRQSWAAGFEKGGQEGWSRWSSGTTDWDEKLAEEQGWTSEDPMR